MAVTAQRFVCRLAEEIGAITPVTGATAVVVLAPPSGPQGDGDSSDASASVLDAWLAVHTPTLSFGKNVKFGSRASLDAMVKDLAAGAFRVEVKAGEAAALGSCTLHGPEGSGVAIVLPQMAVVVPAAGESPALEQLWAANLLLQRQVADLARVVERHDAKVRRLPPGNAVLRVTEAKDACVNGFYETTSGELKGQPACFRKIDQDGSKGGSSITLRWTVLPNGGAWVFHRGGVGNLYSNPTRASGVPSTGWSPMLAPAPVPFVQTLD